MSENRRRRAFTLVELLVAIGIIVILIGLLLPAINHVRKAAYGASTAQQISVLSSAIEHYHDDFNAYPGPLPLNQINYNQSNTSDTTAVKPFVYNLAGNQIAMSGTTPPPASLTVDPTKISGAQNLVLGLLGGLTVTRTPNANGQLDITAFQYQPTIIFAADSMGNPTKIPSPSGPQSLAIGTTKIYSPYMTVQASDLSVPTYTATPPASFADAASRSPMDTIIPVFLDKYPDAMPILYMRAQRGASGLVSFAGYDKSGGNSLANDQASGQTITSWQYDLREIYPYTNSDGTPSTSNIGVNMSRSYFDPTTSSSKVFVHGLQKVWASQASPPAAISSSTPTDAWAYLRNPSLGPTIPTSAGATDIGVPREKDGYILISAGPDRLYGTTDDIANFGSVAP